jgi:DNA-binding phage protein
MLKNMTYEQALIGYLQDPELSIEYLNAALEEGDSELFKTALKNVAKARKKARN